MDEEELYSTREPICCQCILILLVRSGYIFVVFFTRNGPHRRRIFGTEPTKAVIKRFVRLDHFMTVVEQNVFEVHSALSFQKNAQNLKSDSDNT